MFRRYARGETPLDLSRSRSDLGLSAKQLRHLVSREGWAEKRGSIAATKQRAASDVLATVRADTTDDLERVLRSVKAGLVDDAKRLESGWQYVGNAADVSALQRGKGLHLARTLKLYGLDKPEAQDGGRAASVSLIFARFGGSAAGPGGGPVNVTETGTAELEADEPHDDLNFDFEPGDER